jgi:hypothetical protein
MTMAYQNLNQTPSEYPVVFGLPNQSFEIFVFVIGNELYPCVFIIRRRSKILYACSATSTII